MLLTAEGPFCADLTSGGEPLLTGMRTQKYPRLQPPSRVREITRGRPRRADPRAIADHELSGCARRCGRPANGRGTLDARVAFAFAKGHRDGPRHGTAVGSFAAMTYAHGSVFFPGYVDGAPRLLRMRVDSGALTSWPAVRPDHAGWSALAAGDGVACYGDDANAVHCACVTTFQ